MTQIQLRRGTASEWTAANPVLAAGEVGVIGTTGDFKIGDGATTWNLLAAQSSRYAPDWVGFAPVVKFGGVAAAIGGSDCRWHRVGKLVTVEIAFQFNGGAGLLTIARPVVGRTTTLASNYVKPLGVYTVFDISAAQAFSGVVSSNTSDGSDVVFRNSAAPAVPVTSSTPFAMAGGDEIHATYTYEALT